METIGANAGIKLTRHFTNQTGVQNVNGNIPDTTNAIDLSTHKKDSTEKPAESVK